MLNCFKDQCCLSCTFLDETTFYTGQNEPAQCTLLRLWKFTCFQSVYGVYNYLSGTFFFNDETGMHELYLLQWIQYLHLYVILELDSNSPLCEFLKFFFLVSEQITSGLVDRSPHSTHSPLNFFIHGSVKDIVRNPAVTTGTDGSHQQLILLCYSAHYKKCSTGSICSVAQFPTCRYVQNLISFTSNWLTPQTYNTVCLYYPFKTKIIFL
jgi:hypothetical protein